MRAAGLLAHAGLLLFGVSADADVLIRHVTVYDGTGAPPFAADVRIQGDRIAAIAPQLDPLPGETVRDAHGLALAPGFIDMHSHGNGGLLEDLDAATVSRQGVTTILRLQAMGKDLYRPATAQELAQMKSLLKHELTAGAFGLSTGLEYEAAHLSTTEEVVELSKVAAATGGFYISHVRDEANRTFEAFDEVLRIGREARIPVQITHVKLGSTPVWHQAAARMPAYFEQSRREHINLKADMYPYTFWHSTIRVIVPDRDYFNAEKVAGAIADNGGAAAIRLGKYTPEPALAGQRLEQVAATWLVTPVEAYMRIVKATASEVGSVESMENVLVTSMSEDDLRWFIAHPDIMFSSDGELHGTHPRGAGCFPPRARPLRA
jgi:N-acyl-D-amino-acid deacylase